MGPVSYNDMVISSYPQNPLALNTMPVDKPKDDENHEKIPTSPLPPMPGAPNPGRKKHDSHFLKV